MRSSLAAAVLSSILLAPIGVAQRPGVSSPEQFLGHAIGADHFLASYTQLSAYWQQLAAESDRMLVEDIGATSYGQRHLMAVISSPANLRRLEELRSISGRLCRAEGLDDTAARALAERGRAVVWIDAGIHATESVAAQNILELVWQMLSRDDAEVRRILDEVVLLVCPANPDGMEMIANAYMATGRVGDLPVLYQRWIGHDNNRDFYACNQAETRNINRIFYRRWYPQIIYNHHQTAPRGTVIFTPPFRDPFNYNVDPIVERGISLVAAHINQRFASEGKAGVISRTGAPYSTWWNGGLRTTAYFHNMIGILTESFGSPNPTELRQPLSRRLPTGDYPMPVPTQVWHARQTIDYLQTANFAILDLAARFRERFLFDIYRMGRNAIERGSRDHWTVTPKFVAAAEERQRRAREGVETASDEEGTDAGEATESEGPARGAGQRAGALAEDLTAAVFTDPQLRDARAYVLPADQPDFGAATRFVNALFWCGIDVYRLTQAAEIAGRRYPADSYYVPAAQAFRAHVLDMFEPQWHPTDVDAKGDPVRPYDSAGWTLAMQMDIGFDRLRDAPPDDLPASLVKLEEPAVVPAGSVGAAAPCYLLDARDLNVYRAINRLLAAGERVGRLRADQPEFPAGTLCVTSGERTRSLLAELAEDLGLDFVAAEAPPAAGIEPLRAVRIGLFDVYGGNMATGWTQWVLEQGEFPVQLVFGKRLNDGDLRRDFDVLLFHTGLPNPRDGGRTRRALRRGRPSRLTDDELERMLPKLPPFEDWSTVRDRRTALDRDTVVPELRRFVEQGGSILAFGDSAAALVSHFELPIREGTWLRDEDGSERRTRTSEFFVPGSLLRIELADGDPLGAGASRQLATLFRSNPVFAAEAGAKDVTVHARYTSVDVLASGWAIGEDHLRGQAAVLSAKLGAGRVFLFGPDVIYRGQPTGTWKLVFNAILSAGS